MSSIEIQKLNLEQDFKWITPRPGRVLVLIDHFEYKGRLIIPDRAQAPPTTGKVISVGQGVEGIEIGEKIVFGTYSGTLLRFKNKPVLRVLSPDEVLCTINEETTLEGTEA